MNKNDKNPGRQLTNAEAALLNVQQALDSGDQDLLYKVRSRFDGLVNAYKGDAVATGMINMLMAEHSIKAKIMADSTHTDKSKLH